MRVTADATADKALNVPAHRGADGRRAARRAGARQPQRSDHRHRVRLAHLPPLRPFPEGGVSQGEKELIDTGKIRFIVREFPIGHTSGTAAIINRCAPEDKYFSLFNAFLLRQPEWVSQEVRPDAIYSVAKSSGMSRETFDKCLTRSNHYRRAHGGEAAGAEIWRGRHADLFANGRKAQGTITFEEFKALLGPQSST